MMFQQRLFKLFVSLALTILLTLTGTIPVWGKISPASGANISANSSIDWYQVDRDLINALRIAHDSTEEFAAAELNDWVDNLMEKVDDNFLKWYFSYWNQKAQEFGIPFAWLAFNADSYLKIFRREDEQNLTVNEILRKRMIDDFDRKFNQLVLDEESKKDLIQLTERVGRNYAAALGMKLATVKYTYNIADEDWERYLNDIATMIYGTGNSRNSLEISSMMNNFANKLIIVGTAVGSKLAVSFAVKAAAKIVGKASGAILAKVGAQLIDPVLGIGILAWDVWDYNNMVKQSRPGLRQNILDYLTEVKSSILNSPENSIMAAIEEVEGKIMAGLESKLMLKAS